MTTFSTDELTDLSYAQDLSPDPNNIDFEMLMQRDLDRERVRKELVPYLMGAGGETAPEPIYFPPLIAAAVPVEQNSIERCFKSPVLVPREDEESVSIKWPGAVEFSYYCSEEGSPQAYNIKTHDIIDEWVDREPVAFKAKLARSSQSGIKLVVIDGQHRLCALRDVLERNVDTIKGMTVPVCIVVSPLSYAEYIESYGIGAEIHRVYRKLFVDVNTTMESVSGHFGVLLKDSSIGSIIAREFCDYVLQEKGLKGLALIEWSTKSAKDASKVIRPWSAANVKVLDQSLHGSFKHKYRIAELDAIIHLPEIERRLETPG